MGLAWGEEGREGEEVNGERVYVRKGVRDRMQTKNPRALMHGGEGLGGGWGGDFKM